MGVLTLRCSLALAILSSAALAPASGQAQESHISIVVGLEQRTADADILETRVAFQALEEPIHRCFWDRKTTAFPPGYQSKVESDWRVARRNGAVTAAPVRSKREGEVSEKSVLDCFSKELEKVKLGADGQSRVLLTFSPIGLTYPIVRVRKFDFVGKRPDKPLASLVEGQVRTNRKNLCVHSYKLEGSYDAHVKIQPTGWVNIESEASAVLSCALGVERDQVPMPPGDDPIEFKVSVEIKKGPDRRPFEARQFLSGVSSRLDEDEVRHQTEFGDAEVWRRTGRTSTNRLRSVCLAASAQPEKKRYITACSSALCECSTEYYSESWGDRCQPYVDAGRPDQTAFIAGMFTNALQEHQAEITKCGARCAAAAKLFQRDCKPFLGGKP